MKRSVILVLLLVLVASATALAYPTENTIKALREHAMDLYQKRDWEEASIAMFMWAKEADDFYNLVVQATQPYAQPSNTRLQTDQLSLIVEYQNIAKKYRLERNEALIYRAECYWNDGEGGMALDTLSEVLDLLTRDEWEQWTKARMLLSEILDLSVE